MSDGYEKEAAAYEAERNRAWHSWFAARGHISPTDEHTLIFDGGFRMAWEFCRAQPSAEPVAWIYSIDDQHAVELRRYPDDEIADGCRVTPLYAHPSAPADEAVLRDRDSDRVSFPDPAFNAWLDEGISDSGHTVWDLIGSVPDAWAAWENRPYYEERSDD